MESLHREPRRRAVAQTSLAYVVASRLLLVLTGILLAVSPWTEYFWDWDRFLHGGQDCEFGLLAIALAFGLVLVLSRKCREGLAVLLAMLRLVRFLFRLPSARAHAPASRPISLSHRAEHLASLVLTMRSLPLRI